MKHLFAFMVVLFQLDCMGYAQQLNRDSISFVHSYGCINEDDSLSIFLANGLYRMSIKAKAKQYPSFYGGTFIKNDSIVFLVTKSASLQEVIDIVTEECIPYVEIRPCEYSYRDLLGVQERLDKVFFRSSNRELVEHIIGWSSFHLSIQDNRILILLNHCTNDYIRLFKQHILDSPMLLFKEADKYIHI